MIKKGGVLSYFGVLFFILSIICSGFFYWQKEAQAETNSILINEIAWMGTETSANDEWIELFNMTDQDIVLDGWSISSQDGTPQIDLLGTIKANSYYLLERSDDDTVPDKIADLIYTGALGNSGEYLELKNASGTAISFLDASSAWLAGDNTTKQTMSRTSDGEWLSSLSSLGTPAEVNDFASSSEVASDISQDQASSSSTIKNETSDYSVGTSASTKTTKGKSKIIISEIFPNPKGSDEQTEFIELYNAGQETVDLFEWQIADEGKRRFRFKISRKIKAKSYLILFRKETKLAMNNNGDTISLYKKDRKTALQKISYKKASENMSYNCLTSDLEILGKLANVDCLWSETLTPGEANKIHLPNRAPNVDFSVGDFLLARNPILFDSSDTIDLDDDELEYSWDFGDGYFSYFAMPDHTFAKAGEYEVLLEVSDGELSAEAKRKINIMDWKINTEELTSSRELILNYKDIKISQVLPNPEGTDIDGEYVEIINSGQDKINLLNWQIDDAEGGSRPYTFKNPLYLSAGQSYLLAREDSGIALNNNRDEVRIIAPDKSIVDLLSYSKPKEGEVYGRGAKTEDKKTINKKKSLAVVSKTIKKNNYTRIELRDIENQKIGSKVFTEGIVLVGPGVVASQYFYITNARGVQVYNYKKYFPDLTPGDYISVKGELGIINEEYRIKTKTADDIKIIKHVDIPPVINIKIKELKDVQLSLLYKIGGEVVEKKGSSLYLDDGSAEFVVYIKLSTDIIFENIKKGDELEITGILSNSTNGRRLIPRSQKDIVFLNDQNTSEKQKGRVLGEEIQADTWTLDAREDQSKKNIYLYIFAVFLVIVFVTWFTRKRTEIK